MIPGEYILKDDAIIANKGKETIDVKVVNTGDRPVQVGSHFHFFEVNQQMSFNRQLAFGMHLDIAAGTAVRFEPGEEKIVTLVAFGGNKTCTGFNNLADDIITDASREAAMQKIAAHHFKNNP